MRNLGKRGIVPLLPLGAGAITILVVGIAVILFGSVFLVIFNPVNILTLVGATLLILAAISQLRGRSVPRNMLIIGVVLVLIPVVSNVFDGFTLGAALALIGG